MLLDGSKKKEYTKVVDKESRLSKYQRSFIGAATLDSTVLE